MQDGTVTFTQGETTIEGVKNRGPAIKANSAKLLEMRMEQKQLDQ